MRRTYVRVLTSKIVPDMTRYMSYTGVEETDEPAKVTWPSGQKVTLHRFQEGEYTYFMRPSCNNPEWDRMMIARYRSFGVIAEDVRREAKRNA